MRRSQILLLLPLIGACGGPPGYSAPAPAGALDCALREALDLGYRRMEGGAGEGMARVSQRPDPRPGEGAVQPDPSPGTGQRLEEESRPEENHLLFREEGGRLHVQVLGVAEGSPVAREAPAADAHARLILATCSTP